MSDKVMTYQETKQRLEELDKKAKKLIKELDDIRDILTNWELSLQDADANEEALYNAAEELQDTLKEIVSCRMWLDFLSLEHF